MERRARSEGAKLPQVAPRRVGSLPPERKAPVFSQSTERSKLPSIGPRGYRVDMAAPKRGKPPTPPSKPPRPEKVGAEAAGSGAREEVSSDLKNYVSDELRKVLEEEEVSYTWRRRPKQAPEAAAASNARFSPKSDVKVSKVSRPAPAAPAAPAVRAAVAAVAAPAGFAAPKSGAGYTLAVKEGTSTGSKHTAVFQPRFCSKLEPKDVTSVRLVSYDGGAPMLAAGPLCSASTKTARPPGWFLQWIEGGSSSALFSLAADDWLRGEGLEPPGSSGGLEGVPPKALIAGLLADPSLSRFGETSPTEACCKALHEVLAASEEGSELLTSQVEVALGRLEPPRAVNGAVQLWSALRRELLRCLWCAGSFDGPSSTLGDAWLLQQLQQQTEAETEEEEEQLRRENDFLDQYLVRLLKLKRSLSFLLETWQKVDHYEVLGVSSSASDQELKQAYRKACLRLHPDKGGDKQQFQQLQDSYARILEERQRSRSVSAPSKPKPKSASKALSIEGQDGSHEAASFAETGEVASGIAHFQALAEEMRKMLQQAFLASDQIQNLAAKAGDLTESLATAQEAGESLLELSSKIGALAPRLSDASMEVAESSLALAARHGAVPVALLLTDVALSMTFEASRLQQTGKSLLEVQRDTTGTLQTLQQNLSMARILGSVDTETFKLSMGLVRKATSRIMNCIKEVQKANLDALQRGQHCLIHAHSVCRFAAGRTDQEDEVAGGSTGLSLEPDPSGPAFSKPPAPEPPAPAAAAPAAPAEPPKPAVRPQQQRRAQNQRLLRQLNAEVKDLQKRAKAAMKESQDADVSALIRELLWVATDAVLRTPDLWHEPQLLRAHLAQEFHFVEVCGIDDLAVPCLLSSQLLRYAVLVGVADVLEALQQAKRRLLQQATGEAAMVLEQHFELLSAAVVAAR